MRRRTMKSADDCLRWSSSAADSRGSKRPVRWSSLFRSVGRFYPHVRKHDVNIVLVEGGKTLLPGLPPRMGAYSERDLRRRGVTVITGDGVRACGRRWTRASERQANRDAYDHLERGRYDRARSREAGTAARQERHDLGRAGYERAGIPGVWAIGDCAAIPNGEGGSFYPPTARSTQSGKARCLRTISSRRCGDAPTSPSATRHLG